jgi:hypothetical protein
MRNADERMEEIFGTIGKRTICKEYIRRKNIKGDYVFFTSELGRVADTKFHHTYIIKEYMHHQKVE